MSADKKDCLMITCCGCNRVVYAAAAVVTKEKPEQAEIGELIANGHKSDYVTAETVRKADWGCECKKEGGSK